MSDDPDSGLLPSYATAHVNRAAALLTDTDAPAQVGPYRIIELIGQGGMGEVYRAAQEEPVHRTVALKLIKLGMDSRQIVRRFEAERETLAKMAHPNIARILDAGLSDNGRPYVAMELVPGRPITEYCDEHQLTIRQRLELFIQVCDAVQHAHTKTIIHRDLKPANMLVCEQDGRAIVKVIDFGVAKALGQDAGDASAATRPGQFVGTPRYMSPEQAVCDPVDTRTDIYSMGIVLYELLAGALPFDRNASEAGSLEEIRRLHWESEAPRPSTRLSMLGHSAADIARHRRTHAATLARQLRSELDWIPLKALRKEPHQRYRTASELADDIQNYLNDRPLIAGPESRLYRLRKLVRRNRGLVAASATVGLALVMGLAGTGWMYVRSERMRTLVVKNEARAQSEAAKQAAVNQFLMEVLGAGNPHRRKASDQDKGRTTTVLEALSGAARKVDAGALRDQPAVEAAVRLSIGYTYKGLGEYDQAAQQLQRAVQLSQAAYGTSSPEHASALHLLGMLLFQQGRLIEAEASCRQALDIRRGLAGAEPDRSTAQSLNDLSNILQQQGRLGEAEPLQRDAIAICTALYGEQSRETAAGLLNLGHLQHLQGKLDEADTHTRRAVAIHRKVSGEMHPDVATALSNLASLRRSQGQLDEAQTLYRQALEIDLKLFGHDHPNVATGFSHLASLALRQGNLADAERLANESLTIRTKLLGLEHPDVAWSLDNLGRVQRAQNRADLAESAFRRAHEIMRKALGDAHPNVALIAMNLSGALRDQAKLSEAELLLRDALGIIERKLPAGHPRHAEAIGLLGEILLDQARYADAELLLIKSRESIEANPASSPTLRTETVSRLVRLYEAWGEPEKAAEWRNRSPSTSVSR